MKRGIYIILITIFITGAILSGYFAWQESRHARVDLEWTTASEINTIGFYIYRSNSPDQGYDQVNMEMIPVVQDSLTGSEYSYTDIDVIPGAVYYYILEDVNMNGQAVRSSPIEVKARSNYWGYLLVSLFFFMLSMLLIINRRWFLTFFIRYGNESQ